MSVAKCLGVDDLGAPNMKKYAPSGLVGRTLSGR